MSDKLNQLIELLKLEKIDDLIFRGACEDLGFRQVFGGQVVAQSLSAAMQVAPPERILHSCHAYFLAPGDSQHPIIYDVETLREGRNFSALRVKAIQHKNVICHVTASFQVPEEGFDHQSAMPQVPGPEQCIDEHEIMLKVAQTLPESLSEKFAQERPFQIHSRYLNNPFDGRKLPPEQYAWFKTNEHALRYGYLLSRQRYHPSYPSMPRDARYSTCSYRYSTKADLPMATADSSTSATPSSRHRVCYQYQSC